MSVSSSNLYSRKIIILLVGIIVVFIFPYGYHIDNGPGPNGIMAITWELPMGRHLTILSALEYFIYYLYRFVVLFAIWKLLIGKISQKRVMLHGWISEFIPVLISIPGILFLNAEGEGYIPIMIPIPFLLIYVIVLIHIVFKRNAL